MASALAAIFSSSSPRPSSLMTMAMVFAGLARGNRQQTDLALASGEAGRRGFDPVVDGVADQVGERIADRFDHLAVEFDVAAVAIDHHLLAEFGGQVAHQPGQGGQQGFDPLHPHPRDRVAHVGQDRSEPFERPVDGRLVPGLSQPVGQIVARQHHVADAAHHPVEQFDRQADGALGGGVFPRGGRDWRNPRRGPADCSQGRARVLQTPPRPRHGPLLPMFHRGIIDRQAISRRVAAFGIFLSRFDGIDHRRDPVDDGEYGGHHRAVGIAASGAAIGQRVFGGMAERGKAREIEKTRNCPSPVWTKRKIASSRARSAGSASQATISPLEASSIFAGLGDKNPPADHPCGARPLNLSGHSMRQVG